MKTLGASITLLIISFGSGCVSLGGHAQLVRGDRYGGEVRLSGGYMDRAADALLVMSDHCDGRFVIFAPDGAATEYVDAPGRAQDWAEFECVPSDGRLAEHAPLARASH